MRLPVIAGKKILLFMILMIALDFLLRYDELKHFTNNEWGFYLISVLYLFLIIREINFLLKKLYFKSKMIYSIFLSLFLLIFLTIEFGSYHFYQYFSILPNVFTFEYMYGEFFDFLFMATNDLSILLIFIFLFVLAISFFIADKLIKKTKIKRNIFDIIISFIFIIFFFFVFNNNVRFYPGSSAPFVNTSASFSKATFGFMANKETGFRLLNEASRKKLPSINKALDINVLVIFNESLRALSSNTHGYEKNTTPFQTKFLRDNDGIVFSNFYAVSSRTRFALPSFFTGISSVQPSYLMFQMPIFSDFSKMFNNTDNFLISAQSYQWASFIKFIDDHTWDKIYYKENSNQKAKNEVCIDDKYVVQEFDQYLSAKDSTHKFFGVLHLNGTHHPYYHDKEDEYFSGSSVEDTYNNAVRTIDKHTKSIIMLLKKYKLIDNTIVFFSSDHAEAFGEHGYNGHLHTFYEEEAKIPGWMYIPKKLREKSKSIEMKYEMAKSNKNKNMTNIDLMPTFLDLINLWNHDEIKDIQKNYIGTPITEPIDSLRIVHFQNYSELNKSQMFKGLGLKYKNFKYLLHTKYGKFVEEVYNLKEDPQEQKNIIEELDPDILALFHKELLKYNNSKKLYDDYKRQ